MTALDAAPLFVPQGGMLDVDVWGRCAAGHPRSRLHFRGIQAVFGIHRSFFFCFLLMPAAVFAQSVTERARQDELVFMADETPAMQRAFHVARSALDEFFKLAGERSESRVDYSLKVAISEGRNTEYFWVTDFKALKGDRFEGTIGNTPQMVMSVQLGQRYVFTKARIVDWLYIDKAERRMVGNFTLCALLTQESKDEAERVLQRFNLDCSRILP